MKNVHRAFAVAATALGLALAAAPRAGRAQSADGFVVHEWGVIVTAPDIDTTPGPPPFVHVVDPQSPVFELQPGDVEIVPGGPIDPGEIRVMKPIVYFYPRTNGLEDVHVWLEFPAGSFWGTIFYPAADVYERHQGGVRPLDPRDPGGALHFDLRMMRGSIGGLLSAGGWWQTCRIPDPPVIAAEAAGEIEKFLFYEAPLVPLDPPTFTLSGDELAVQAGAAAVYDAMVIRRAGSRLEVAAIDALGAGERATATLARVDPDGFKADLLARLVRAGLFEDEAHALIEVWKDSLDGEPAITLYRLAPETIERMVSMEILPAPDRLVRVWLVAGHIE